MFSNMREVCEGSVPDLSCSILVTVDNDGRTQFCNKVTLSDVYDILTVKIPSIKAGTLRMFAAWRGQWRTDVFEITAETADLFKDEVIHYGSRRYPTFEWKEPVNV